VNLNDLKQVNRLWKNIYPYLALQIMEGYKRIEGTALELGPFSGGISLELTRMCPGLKITIADKSREVLEYMKKELQFLGDHIQLEETKFENLVFQDSQFDLIIFRGAFFFLDKGGRLLQEILRILKEGGMAFVGGGYGKGTPGELIDDIADESRRLNERLGRKRVKIHDLEKMIRKSGQPDRWKIVEAGGLWLITEY
jgi:ubiquinone/menaquinone biosynthesis C-methylase UbiE